MSYDSTLTVANGSSIVGNTAGEVSSPAFALAFGLVDGSSSDHLIIRDSIAGKERLREDRARR